MKQLLLLCAALFVVQLATAQRNPSNEILVYFKEGVVREKKREKGVEVFGQTIKSEILKSKLQALDISEDMLETALPEFNEADTLKTLSNGEKIPMLNMTKLCRITLKAGQSKKELLVRLNALPEVLYAEANVSPKPLGYPQR